MNRIKDITGQKFGKLFVESFAGTKKSGSGSRSLWNCICDCGNKCVEDGYSMRSGNTTSCGCVRNQLSSKRRQQDLTGKRFSKLTVVEKAYIKDYKVYWKCLCDCGNICYVTTGRLNYGTTRSCGCILKDVMGPKLYVDISNKRSGKLVAIEPTDMRSHRQVLWLCKCDCGGITYVTTTDFLSGHVVSCGCVKSKGEELIAKLLTEQNIKYRKNYKIDDLFLVSAKGRKTRLMFDFAVFDNDNNICCLIEFQGIQHYQQIGPKGFGDQQRLVTDPMKRNYCKDHNISLYEIRYDEDVETCLNTILHTHANPVGNVA